MRPGVPFVFAVLVACDPAATPSETDPTDGTVLTCASDGIRDTSWYATWRGTFDVDAGTVELVRGDLHTRGAGLGVEPRSLSTTAAGTWTDEGVVASGDVFSATLAWTPAGFLVGSATIDGEATGLSCWPASYALPYRYDAGECRDAEGAEGRHVAPIAYFRETGLGMCTDFETVAVEEGDLSYPEWVGADLRGADLSRAAMHFATFTDVRLEGTALDGFDFGYVVITGTIDAHTTLPPECTPDGTTVECMR